MKIWLDRERVGSGTSMLCAISLACCGALGLPGVAQALELRLGQSTAVARPDETASVAVALVDTPGDLAAVAFYYQAPEGFSFESLTVTAEAAGTVAFADDFGGGVVRVTVMDREGLPMGDGVVATLHYPIPLDVAPGNYAVELLAAVPAGAPQAPNPEARSLGASVLLPCAGAGTVITVLENAYPVIDLAGGDLMDVESHTGFQDPRFTSDNGFGTSADGQVVISGVVDANTVGDYLVTYTVTNFIGNTTTVQRLVRVRDTLAPVLSLSPDLVLEASAADGAQATFTNAAEDLAEGTVPAISNPPSGSVFPLGTTVVNVTTSDSHGNTATGSFEVTVVDTTAPTIGLPADLLLEGESPQGAVGVFAASAVDVVDGSVATTCDPVSGSIFPLGATTVTVTASDARGNVSQGRFVVTVVDTTAPVIERMPDMVVQAVDASGVAVVFPDPVVADIVDVAPVVVCTPPSGTVLPTGTHLVECTAVDASGNIGRSSFSVVVQGLLDVAAAISEDLTSALATATGAEAKSLGRIADNLQDALDPTLWEDSTHLDPDSGHLVFNELHSVLNDLQKMTNSTSSSLTTEQIDAYIDLLALAARTVAVTAIDDAVASGASERDISKGRQELDKGDRAVAAGNAALAINHYQTAWNLLN